MKWGLPVLTLCMGVFVLVLWVVKKGEATEVHGTALIFSLVGVGFALRQIFFEELGK